ncbi:Polysaccharide biosynthesis protein [Burkholderia multivorans]
MEKVIESEVQEDANRNDEIHARAKSGIRTMISRQIFTQVFTFGAGVVLARHLVPADFGLFAIATFFVTTIAQFGSFGLGASLVQNRQEIVERDLSVAFTLQQIVIVSVVILLNIGAGFIGKLYPHQPEALVWLIRAISLNLFLTSWKTMSELQLERKLAFHMIARIEIAETLTYQTVAVLMALDGFGVWSLVAALIARSLLGTLLAFFVAPWPVRFMFDKDIAARILRFGVPYQIQTIMNSVSSWIIPLFVGPLVGPHAVGYLNWASSNGKKPLLLVDAVMRVSFPHFARLQDQPEEVERILRHYLTWLLIPAGLWFSIIFSAAHSLVPLVYTQKWAPAIPALILCALAVGVDCIGWIVVQSQSALGHVGQAVRLTTIRSTLNVTLGIGFVYWLGFIGVPIAYLIAYTICTPWAFSGMRAGSAGRVLRSLLWIALPVVASCATGYAAGLYVEGLLLSSIVSISVSILVFSCVLWVTAPNAVTSIVKLRVTKVIAGARSEF